MSGVDLKDMVPSASDIAQNASAAFQQLFTDALTHRDIVLAKANLGFPMHEGSIVTVSTTPQRDAGRALG